MDIRLKNDAVFQVVGPTGCGKTLFVTQLLSNSEQYFINKVKHIYWLMGVVKGEKGQTSQGLEKLKNLEILNGFEEGWLSKPRSGDAIVVDDLYAEAVHEKNFNNLFTKISRHRGVTVMYILRKTCFIKVGNIVREISMCNIWYYLKTHVIVL